MVSVKVGNRFALLLFVFTAILSIGYDADFCFAADGGSAVKAELVSVLETSVVAIEAALPYEFVVKEMEVTTFGKDEIGGVSDMKSRVILDLNKEDLIYAKVGTLEGMDAKIGKHMFITNGLTFHNGKPTSQVIMPIFPVMKPFIRTVSKTPAMLPQYCGVFQAPFNEHQVDEFGKLSSAILRKDSTVTKRQNGTKITYDLKVPDGDEKHYYTYQWVIDAKTNLIDSTEFRQSIDGTVPLPLYYSQDIIYEDIDGTLLPTLIVGKKPRGRKIPNTNMLEKGWTTVDIELQWLKIRQTSESDSFQMDSQQAVEKFVSQGFDKAKEMKSQVIPK